MRAITISNTPCKGRFAWSGCCAGRHLAGVQPRLTQQMFQLGLVAILLHDTGYLKKRDDTEGTGAKYTVIHVHRSAEFAAHLLQEKGFSATDIQAVQNMILCTGVNAALSVIPLSERAGKSRRLGAGHR